MGINETVTCEALGHHYNPSHDHTGAEGTGILPAIPRQSPREQLYALHNALTSDALALMKKKNVDYADSNDPYENFRTFGRLGILVRMSDKIARLKNYEKNGKFAVEDEGLKDTIVDIINYAVLFYGYK